MAQNDEFNRLLSESGVVSVGDPAVRVAQAKLALGIQPSNKEMARLVDSQFYEQQRMNTALEQGKKDAYIGFTNTPQARLYSQATGTPLTRPRFTADELLAANQPGTVKPEPRAPRAPGAGEMVEYGGQQYVGKGFVGQDKTPRFSVGGVERKLPEAGISIQRAEGGQTLNFRPRALSDAYISKAREYIRGSESQGDQYSDGYWTATGFVPRHPDDYNPAQPADVQSGQDFQATPAPVTPKALTKMQGVSGTVDIGKLPMPAPVGTFGLSSFGGYIPKPTEPPKLSKDVLSKVTLSGVAVPEVAEKKVKSGPGYSAQDLLKQQANLPPYLRTTGKTATQPANGEVQAPIAAQPQAAAAIQQQAAPAEQAPVAQAETPAITAQPLPQQPMAQRAQSQQQPFAAQPYNPFAVFRGPGAVSESLYGKQARAQSEHEQKMQLETYKANVNAQSKSLRDSFYAANQVMGLKEKELQVADKKLQQQFASNPSPVQVVDLGGGKKEAFVMTSYGHWTHVSADKNKPSGILKHPVDEKGNPIEHIWIDAVTNQRVNVEDPLMQQMAAGKAAGSTPATQPAGKPSAQGKGSKQLSQQEAAAILNEAGGDKAKARQLATSRGYSF